jgi:hypothetical protein
MVPLSHPLILFYLALRLENLSNFVIRQNVQPSQHLKPFSNQLISLLSCDETALIAYLPDTLRILLFIHIPIKRRGTVRIEEHQHFRQMAIAIEDVLTRVTAYIDQPV